MFAGGLSGHTLVAQLAKGTRSDLWLYSTRTRRFRKAPRGVNTKGWDWGGQLSHGYLMVVHGATSEVGRRSIALVRLATGRSTTLRRMTGPGYIEPGQVLGRYAAYDVCNPVCRVFRYDRVARTTVSPPSAPDRFAYHGAVTADGTLYYTLSGDGCGVDTAILRWKPGRPPVVLTTFPGFDTADMQTGNWVGVPTLYVDRVDCTPKHDGDLVELPLLSLPT